MNPKLTRLLERQAVLLAELEIVQRDIRSAINEVIVSNCGVCGVDFESDRRNALYCSDACKMKAYRDRKKLEKEAT